MSDMNLNDFMVDHRGRLVPKRSIAEFDLARNDLVNEIVSAAKSLQALLKDFKYGSLGDISAFIDLAAEQHGVSLGGKKGNVSLMSFDGTRRIRVAVQEYLRFDEQLQAAKVLIDECLEEWTEGTRDELRTIVYDAFSVDQEGRINTRRVLTLRRYKIEDERWLRAMVIIADSLTVVSSKTYLRIYEKVGDEGQMQPISLDMASL